MNPMKFLTTAILSALSFCLISATVFAECVEAPPETGQRTKEGKCYEYMILRDCADNQETEIERLCGSTGEWTTIYNGPIREGGAGVVYPIGPLVPNGQGDGVGSVPSGTGGQWVLVSAMPIVVVDFIPNEGSILIVSGAMFEAYALGFE